jgi:hypothetical protein
MYRPQHFWFPAKRYGWGWGLPSAWQGWVVLALYLALMVAICVTYPPHTGAFRFIALIALATSLLTVVCWVTGEPPHWSWGERRTDDS